MNDKPTKRSRKTDLWSSYEAGRVERHGGKNGPGIPVLKQLLDTHCGTYPIDSIYNASSLDNARTTSFVWSDSEGVVCLATNRNYFRQALANDNVAVIIANQAACKYALTSQDTSDGAPLGDKAVVVSAQAAELFYFLHNVGLHKGIESPEPVQNIHDSVIIAPSAIIGDNVRIGENSVIGENCVISSNTVIGKNCTIHTAATIGTPGFFSKMVGGVKTHIEHYGGVRLGDNCIVHTGTNISRSVNYGEFTELADEVHIGIHSNIAHDCHIGRGTDISAKVVVAGRVSIAENVWIGAGVSISNAINIGAEANVKIGSVVVGDVPAKREVSGSFAIDHKRNMKQFLKNKG